MKKFYALAVVLLFALGSANAQSYFWIGPDNGDWNNGNNWSNIPGGPAISGYPQLSTDNATFTSNASVNLNISVSINSVSVIGTNTSAKITGVGGFKVLTVNSTSAATPALNIASSCRLENTATTSSEFQFLFASNSVSEINGDWYFTGDIEADAFAYYTLPSSGAGTAVNINNGGSITIGEKGFIDPNEPQGNTYLKFKAGGSLNLLGDGPIVPVANYDAASIINITGVVNASVNFDEQGSVGIINYNCPSQNNGIVPVYLSLITFTVNGSVNILNTNNKELVIINYAYSSPGLPARNATIKGNLNIQGNSVVSVARNAGPAIPNNLFVEGNVIMNGTSLSIHTGPDVNNSPTRLAVKGNIQHTSGIITALATDVNETSDLFIIEMNGSSPQTISSVTGSFDNTAHQVTLRMNNSSGVTLNTSLQVGRLDFSSANKGVVNTGSNVLTLNNTSPASVSSIVVNSPSNSGYVNGNVQRKTLSDEPVVLPVGGGGVYRGATLIPSSAAASTYKAKFFNTGYSDLTADLPLSGVSPDYYWDITRVGAGANAVVQLPVVGAVTGSQPTYGLVVAKYNGSGWLAVKGTTGTMLTPGDATSGVVKSELQSSFSPFTIGFGAQSALPTLLVSFDAKKTAKETADLKWEITLNSTPEVFEVMRSADGVNFSKIGEVEGKEMKTLYQFSDNKILSGNNYYRLRMLDRDGSVTYSVIVMVANGSKGVFMSAIAPTLVTGRTKLSIQSSANTNMQLVVTDVNGRIVHKQSVTLTNGSQDVWLDAARFAPGMFQVTGYVSGEKTATLRFIKL